MKITDAREALANALEDIADSARKKNLTATVSCCTANHDLEEVNDGDESAALVAGEISVSTDSSEEKLVFECALSITEGEVSDEEILRETTNVRASMKELIEKLDSGMETKDAFTAIIPEEDEPEAEPTYDNKKFYIWGSVIAAVVIIILILGRII